MTMRTTLATTAAALLLLLAPTAAHAGGSDSPTPYTVTTEGVQLPDGDTFQAHGHVNVRYYQPDGGVLQTAAIHMDPNNGHPGGKWIGKGFIPWDAFGITEGAEIRWVQVSHHSAHFGEGGQKPVPVHPKPTPDAEDRVLEQAGGWEDTALCETAEIRQQKWLYHSAERREQTVTWNPAAQSWDTSWGDWIVVTFDRHTLLEEQMVRMTDEQIAQQCGMPPTGAPVLGAAALAGVVVLAGAGMVAARKRVTR